MKSTPIIFFLFLIFLSCSNETVSNGDTPTIDGTSTEANAVTEQAFKPTKMLIGLDQLRLRSTPGEKGDEIAFLKKGTVIYDTGEVSNFTTRIKLRGIWFDEPWIKVKTEKGIEGWVYGGAVTFDLQNQTDLANKLLDLRLKSFFGKGINSELHSYRKAYHSASTSQDFSKVFRKGEQLRDTMVTLLEKKIDVVEMDYNQLPDLFWVEEGLPGYETALVAEGTLYYLFKNFKTFQKLAAKTSGKEDDDFVNLNLMVHAQDSIEYFFPSWFQQTWDYGGHSLLGQGTHLKILEQADKDLKKSDLFLNEVIKIKDEVVNDIVGKDITYWESSDKIQKELDDILASNLSILTSDDKVALETRRKMFANPKANGVEVNHRAGME